MSSDEKRPPHLTIAGLISALHICIGLFFWAWSVLLWGRGEYDSGIVLFLFPIATGLVGFRIVYLCWRNNSSNNNDTLEAYQPRINGHCSWCCFCTKQPPIKCWFVLLILSHALTTAVYAFAGSQDPQEWDKSRGWQLYCRIASICWAVSGVVIFVLVVHFRGKFELGEVIQNNEESSTTVHHPGITQQNKHQIA